MVGAFIVVVAFVVVGGSVVVVGCSVVVVAAFVVVVAFVVVGASVVVVGCSVVVVVAFVVAGAFVVVVGSSVVVVGAFVVVAARVVVGSTVVVALVVTVALVVGASFVTGTRIAVAVFTVVGGSSVVVEGREVEAVTASRVVEGTVPTVGPTVLLGTPGRAVVVGRSVGTARRGPVVVVLVAGAAVVGSSRNQFGIRITANGTRGATVIGTTVVAIFGTRTSPVVVDGTEVVADTAEAGTVGL